MFRSMVKAPDIGTSLTVGSCGTEYSARITGVFLSGVDGRHGCGGGHGNDSADVGLK